MCTADGTALNAPSRTFTYFCSGLNNFSHIETTQSLYFYQGWLTGGSRATGRPSALLPRWTAPSIPTRLWRSQSKREGKKQDSTAIVSVWSVWRGAVQRRSKTERPPVTREPPLVNPVFTILFNTFIMQWHLTNLRFNHSDIKVLSFVYF